MTFWKINSDHKPEKVPATKLKNELILEKHLEDWIRSNPEMLGEPLMIIGQQLYIPEVKDRLDLLALDKAGNAVIIELKRGKMSDPVDMQALRYASYISKWTFENFENQAKSFLGQDEDFNFLETFAEFCAQSGIDETPDINSDQRIIIAGAEVRDKLGSVALWLLEHAVDIKIIEIDSYKEGESLLIQPRIIIPQEVNKFSEVGKVAKADGSKPWLTSGRTWHLEKRMKASAREMYFKLDKIVQENTSVSEPSFEQKAYISYQIGNNNWMIVITLPGMLVLNFLIKARSMDENLIAKQLGILVFDKEESFSEKINLPSSVHIRTRNETSSRIIMRIKDDFDFTKPEFITFIKEAYKNFSKS